VAKFDTTTTRCYLVVRGEGGEAAGGVERLPADLEHLRRGVQPRQQRRHQARSLEHTHEQPARDRYVADDPAGVPPARRLGVRQYGGHGLERAACHESGSRGRVLARRYVAHEPERGDQQ